MQSRTIHYFTIIGLALGTPLSLHAATFTPNVFDDPAPVAAPNGCNSGGRCSLREAVLAATASDGTNTIALSEGTYELTIPDAGNPSSGDLDFVGTNYSITVQGQGPDKTKILATPALNDRIMEVVGTSVDLTLQGITFEGGNAASEGGALRYSIGASDPDTFNILNCNFINNHADASGGAVYQTSGNPTVNIDGGTYQNNTTDADGGALYLSHGGSATELDSIKNLVITGNQALSGQAGGILMSSSKGLSVSNVQVTGNQASVFSGGIFVGNGGFPIGLELRDSVISDNTVTNGDGGGLTVSTGGFVQIVNTTFSNNEAQGGGTVGGGANISNGGGIQILGSTFSGNTASDVGGGLYYTGGSGTVHEFTNTTFSGNTANGTGGGGVFTDHTFSISYNNVTIADNTAAGVGGGAWCSNEPCILRNTILSGNDSAGQTDDCAGVFDSDGYNIFGSPNNGDCEPDGQSVGFNATDIVGDPLIGPLADNGGPTQTHNLLAGSPAIDGGNPGGCIDGEGAFLTTDQRGFVRPSGPECDIGAVEAAVTDLAVVKTADDEIYVVGDEITYTLTVTNNGPGISPAVVSDALPAEVSLVSVDAGCSESGGTVTCDLGTLDPGANAAVNIVVEANNDGTVENTATVSGADIDTDPSNDSSSVTVSVLSNDTDGGGCRLGQSPNKSSTLGWGIFGIGLLTVISLRRRMAPLLGALLGATALLGASPLGAATFTPNVFDDPVPVAAPNGCTGQGSNPTRCSLREASLAANASTEANTIVLGEGTYNLTITETGNPESGDLDFIASPSLITIQGAGSGKTIINAGPDLEERILEMTSGEGSLTLTGITFQNGDSPGIGGAVYFSTGNNVGTNDPVTITDCHFLNNHSVTGGGGAYLSGSKPLINIDGAVFEGNSSDDNGGGLYLNGGNSDPATFVQNLVLRNNESLNGNGGGLYQSAPDGIELANVEAVGNKALNGQGGGIYSSNGGDEAVLLSGASIRDNQSGDNGGGAVFSVFGNVTIENAVFSGNTSNGSGALGGGVYVSSVLDVEISGSTFENNQLTASGDGAGAYVSNGGGLKISGATFSVNSTNNGNGGGIYHSGAGGEAGEITNTTVSGNEASAAGGGIFVQHPGLSMNNITVAGNSSDDGAGVFAAGGGTHILRNSIFSANNSSSNSDDCGGSFFNSQGFNIFGSDSNANCEPDGFPVGNNPEDIVGDPLIGPLQDNGGPTLTHNLLAGSPAIDGGNPAGCQDGGGLTLTIDQRGFVRPSGPECDIGAVEAAVTDLAIVKIADDEIYIVGDEITYTLTVTNNGPGISPAIITDALPSQVSLVSIDAGCSESGGTVTCDLGSLDPGESAAVNIVVTANSDGTVDNTATVSGADIDTDPSNDSSSVTVSVLSNDTDGGGCRIGQTPRSGSPFGWGIFGIGLLAAISLRRRVA